jgi:hypothetical protein
VTRARAAILQSLREHEHPSCRDGKNIPIASRRKMRPTVFLMDLIHFTHHPS